MASPAMLPADVSLIQTVCIVYFHTVCPASFLFSLSLIHPSSFFTKMNKWWCNFWFHCNVRTHRGTFYELHFIFCCQLGETGFLRQSASLTSFNENTEETNNLETTRVTRTFHRHESQNNPRDWPFVSDICFWFYGVFLAARWLSLLPHSPSLNVVTPPSGRVFLYMFSPCLDSLQS